MVHWMQLTAICVADSPAIVQKCPGLDRVSFWIVFALLIQDLRMESVAIYRTNSQRLFDTLLSLFWDSFGCHFCLLYYNYFFYWIVKLLSGAVWKYDEVLHGILFGILEDCSCGEVGTGSQTSNDLPIWSRVNPIWNQVNPIWNPFFQATPGMLLRDSRGIL